MVDRRGIYDILVIEDDNDTVEIISRALSKGKWRVTMALNMEDGLLGFDKMEYDLVISDIFMTGMGGIEGIKRMRDIRPGVKVLAMSAGYSEMSSDATLTAAEKIGANEVLPKPFSLKDLRATVARLLGVEEPAGSENPEPPAG